MITDPVVSADRRDIRDAVRRFVRERFAVESVRSAAASQEGFDHESWGLMVDMGWTGLSIPEAHGGTGLGLTEQCILLSELGAALAPVPQLSTAGFAPVTLLNLASDEATVKTLRAIAEGSAVASVTLGSHAWPGQFDDRVTASRNGARWVLSGRAPYCLEGADASLLLIVARIDTGGYGLFSVDPAAAGVTARRVPAVDVTRRIADLTFSSVEGDALHAAPVTEGQVSTVADMLAVLLAAELVGSARQCLEITLDYLRTRHQFGKPIGSFQALKHRCAEMAVELTMVQELVFAAASIADDGEVGGLALAAPLALARAEEVTLHIAEEGIQLHGGIGFTDEAAVGLYYKRALSDAEILARSVDARARLAGLLGYEDGSIARTPAGLTNANPEFKVKQPHDVEGPAPCDAC
ncbi:MAG: acyl-CoA dehydrogenase family protein [Candidatus Eiseniibacteriota bacterium]